jgi:cell division protein FtsL
LLLLHLQEENEQTILSQEEIINDYKKRINKLEEMIMEIAKNIKSPDIQQINEN